MTPDELPRKLLPFPWFWAGRKTVRGLVARIRGLEHVIEEGIIVDRAERAILSDALMVFMRQAERSPHNDGSGLPACQVLLERLMGLPDDFPVPRPGSTRLRAVPWNPPGRADPRR